MTGPKIVIETPSQFNVCMNPLTLQNNYFNTSYTSYMLKHTKQYKIKCRLKMIKITSERNIYSTKLLSSTN